MIKYKIDTITKNKDNQTTVYIHVIGDQKIVQTVSIDYKDKESFKNSLIEKTTKVRNEYEEKEIKRVEIEKILKEI